MRYDINILWIDDTATWQREQEEIFLLTVEEYGLIPRIEYVEKIGTFEHRLNNQSSGFKVFDIIFVDYNISRSIQGNAVISKLRANDIDADVLFYSTDAKNNIRDILARENRTFDGIYVSDRDDFQEKAQALYKKNIRKMLSLSNVRGFLTDKTAENDLIVHSFILRNFETLNEKGKKRIIEYAKKSIESEAEKLASMHEKYISIIKDQEININKLLKLPSSLLTLAAKYHIFEIMLEELNILTFSNHSISEYLDRIVSMRNKVAHKKLDICKQQSHIKYSNDIIQYEKNQCPKDCHLHNDDSKISVDVWMEIVKLTNEYAELFDNILLLLNNSNQSLLNT